MAISLNDHEKRIKDFDGKIVDLGNRITNLEKNPTKTHTVTTLTWSGNSSSKRFTFSNPDKWTGGVVYSGSAHWGSDTWLLSHKNWTLSFDSSSIYVNRTFSDSITNFTAYVVMYK